MSFIVQSPENPSITNANYDKPKFISVTLQIQVISGHKAKCSLIADLEP